MTRSAERTSSGLTFSVDGHELVIRRRYETLSIVNDVLIGIWFTVGSVLFFWDATTTVGVWLFLIGSVELLVRPGIRLTRQVHLQRLPAHPRGAPSSGDDDF
jgi:hypothetical protein